MKDCISVTMPAILLRDEVLMPPRIDWKHYNKDPNAIKKAIAYIEKNEKEIVIEEVTHKLKKGFPKCWVVLRFKAKWTKLSKPLRNG